MSNAGTPVVMSVAKDKIYSDISVSVLNKLSFKVGSCRPLLLQCGGDLRVGNGAALHTHCPAPQREIVTAESRKLRAARTDGRNHSDGFFLQTSIS